ncbi:MAG: hypothetical protein ACR2OU_14030 [Thermomicrobiales bacterium]
MRYTRRQFVALSAVGCVSPWTVSAHAQSSGASPAFGLPYAEVAQWAESGSNTACVSGDGVTLCMSEIGIHWLLPAEEARSPVFRMTLENVNDESPDKLQENALKIAPSDAMLVSSERREDGTTYTLYSSEWLASLYSNNPSLWGKQNQGTFALIVQRAFDGDSTPRAILSLPIADCSVQDVEFQTKAGNREGYVIRAYIDATASIEGKLIAMERALYETQNKNDTSVFGVLFAYAQGSDINSVADVGRASVSTDGKGFDGESRFLIEDDREGVLQAELVSDAATPTLYRLPK